MSNYCNKFICRTASIDVFCTYVHVSFSFPHLPTRVFFLGLHFATVLLWGYTVLLAAQLPLSEVFSTHVLDLLSYRDHLGASESSVSPSCSTAFVCNVVKRGQMVSVVGKCCQCCVACSACVLLVETPPSLVKASFAITV